MQTNESYRVLVIDDSPDMHDVIRKILAADDRPPGPLAGVEAEALGTGAPRRVMPHFEVDCVHQGKGGLAHVTRAREAGRPVELGVEGEPGDIPAAVELGVYRVLEEALRDTRLAGEGRMTVRLLFRDDDLELRLTAQQSGPNRWPTGTMRERIALCGGEIDAAAPGTGQWHLAVRIPRAAEGALL